MMAWIAATEPEEHHALSVQLALLGAWLEAMPSEHFGLEGGARFEAPWWAFHFPEVPAEGLIGLFTRPRTWAEYIPTYRRQTVNWWLQDPPTLFSVAALSLNLELDDLFKGHAQDGMWLYFRAGVPVWMVAARPAGAPTPTEVTHVFPDLAARRVSTDPQPLAKNDPDFLRIFGPIMRRTKLAGVKW